MKGDLDNNQDFIEPVGPPRTAALRLADLSEADLRLRREALDYFLENERPVVIEPLDIMKCSDYYLVDPSGNKTLYTALEIGYGLLKGLEAACGGELSPGDGTASAGSGGSLDGSRIRAECGVDLGDVPDELYVRLVKIAIAARERERAERAGKLELQGDTDVDPVVPRTRLISLVAAANE